MVNGAPGKMALAIQQHALADNRFELIRHSLTGPEISESECRLGDVRIHLIHPDDRETKIHTIKEKSGTFISVDFTHPSAVNGNADFYCLHGLPFVMGTTGGDRQRLHERVITSSISAVVAPNMAKQIVGFQAMLEFGAENFSDLLKGYVLEVRESHQKEKADTSGTAKAIVGYFNRMGVEFAEKDILKERDPEVQKADWGIPEAFLSGHGWHTYTLTSSDKTVRFEFTHNVNGRDIYAKGTLDAVSYLFEKIRAGIKGTVFSMIDVLKGA
jgi:4-hydroxy-tetrahydrodipicolinate reductase